MPVFFVLLVFVGTVLDSRETLELLLGSVRRLKTDPRPTDLWAGHKECLRFHSKSVPDDDRSRLTVQN